MKTRAVLLSRILLLAMLMPAGAAVPPAPAPQTPDASFQEWGARFQAETRMARVGDTAALEAFIRTSLREGDPHILSSVMRFFIISESSRLGMMDGPAPAEVVTAFRHHGKGIHLEAATKLVSSLRSKGREDLAAELDSILQPRLRAQQKRLRETRYQQGGYRTLWSHFMASPLVYVLMAIFSAAISPLMSA